MKRQEKKSSITSKKPLSQITKNYSKSLVVKYGSLEHYIEKRITDFFAFWDKTDNRDTLVISTPGIIKKSGKTPSGEIEKAERLRQRYFKEK